MKLKTLVRNLVSDLNKPISNTFTGSGTNGKSWIMHIELEIVLTKNTIK